MSDTITEPLFGDEERDLLKFSIGVRKKMVMDKQEEGITTNGDMRVVSETLNGMDSSLLALRKLDLDDQKNEQGSKIHEDILSVILESKKRLGSERQPHTDISKTIDTDVFDGEILETEMQISGERLEASDFLEDI